MIKIYSLCYNPTPLSLFPEGVTSPQGSVHTGVPHAAHDLYGEVLSFNPACPLATNPNPNPNPVSCLL